MTTALPPAADPVLDEELPPPPAPGGERLHDLDALRGVAMILGIVLHASLAYIPVFWAVQDPGASADSGPVDVHATVVIQTTVSGRYGTALTP